MPVDYSREAELLAQRFFELSDAVDGYWQQNYGDLSTAQVEQLKAQSQALSLRGQQYSADALGAILERVESHLAKIKRTTQDARDALAHLNDVQKVLNIIDSTVALVAAISSGDVESIGSNVDGLYQAIHG